MNSGPRNPQDPREKQPAGTLRRLPRNVWVCWLMIIGGLFLVIMSARVLIPAASEIAARMGRTNEAVRSLLSRALVALAAKLDRHRDDNA